MGKIEKTLELNITHEILLWADSFWSFLQPIALKNIWQPNWTFPVFGMHKPFVTGLPINLEGKENGGYDVCIQSPPAFRGSNPRLLYLQFKAGTEKSFNRDKKSIFWGTVKKPNIYIEFNINNNKKRNQHNLLRDLAKKSGNKNAVAYVFPKIVTDSQLVGNIGILLNKTLFLTISELDQMASNKNIEIDDGHPHKFLTSYTDYNENEINRRRKRVRRVKSSYGLLGEIFAIRMYRALEFLKTHESFKTISNQDITDAMIKYVFYIGEHLRITKEIIFKAFQKEQIFNKELEYFEKEQEELIEPLSHEQNIFDSIFKAISIYLIWIEEENEFKIETKIPQPPKKFTIEITKEEFKFDFNYDKTDISNIFYWLM